MKIHIVKPTYHFELLENLFYTSLKDLGHSFTPLEDADLIIAIRSGNRKELNIGNEQKFALLQTEAYKVSPHQKEDLKKYGPYPFSRCNADVYWGFDKSDENETYLIIGYHPSLDFTAKGFVKEKYQLGFIGCTTQRRNEVFSKSKFPVRSCNTWDILGGIHMSKECKINIHMNAWDKREALTPWDRITRYLHNKCFFIMEDVCDCPINQVVRFDLKDYESTIDKYINNDKLRQDIAEECYAIYKRDFDMRNILQKKIEELYNKQS